LKLFINDSKAKKNRANMLETDARMAKYSRRGLITSFCAYVICLIFGDFFEMAKEKAVVLGAGLLLITILRGYYLFRFDALYARGPSAWRNRYFFASFLGAGWWSVILVAITLELGMTGETPIIWLYTVIFGSSVASAFAPYSRFLTAYLVFGQLPAAVAAFALGTTEGYLYGVMMLAFFVTLSHQGKATSRSYWQRLEANMALQKRAKSLEEVNLDSRAAMDFRAEFLGNLSHEFRTSLNDVLGALTLLGNSRLNNQQQDLLDLAESASERQLDLVDNVMDYSRIAAKELVLDVAVFNLPRQMEGLIEEAAGEASQHGIELSYAFSEELPSRVKGDAIRFGKIFTYLVSHAIQYSEHRTLLVEAGFKYGKDESGELKVIIRDHKDCSDKKAENLTADSATEAATEGGVALSICRGLAECMGGTVVINIEQGHGVELRFTVSLPIADQKPWRINFSPKLKGKRLLLVAPPALAEEQTVSELNHWGLRVEEVGDVESALIRLDSAVDSEHPFDGMVIWAPGNESSILPFSKQLAEDERHSITKQVLVLSPLLRHVDEVREHLGSCSQVHIISKPLLRQRLHDALMELWYLGDQSLKTRRAQLEFDPQSRNKDKRILLVEDHRVNQMVAKSLLEKLGYGVDLANNGQEALKQSDDNDYDLILMDCQMPEMDGYVATQALRRREEEGDKHTPVIAMTANTTEGIQSRCLAAGMDDYMAKPVRLDDLERRLRRWLG